MWCIVEVIGMLCNRVVKTTPTSYLTCLFLLVTKLMERVQSQASLVKLAPRGILHNRSWSSADEMAEEASQRDEYMGGSFEK